MWGEGCVVVVGGTSGIGRQVAQLFAEGGREVAITSREERRAQVFAGEIGGRTRGCALELARP